MKLNAKFAETLQQIDDLLFEAEASARQDRVLVRAIREMRNGKLSTMKKMVATHILTTTLTEEEHIARGEQ